MSEEWKLVPVNITQAMLDATCCDANDDRQMRDTWQALLSSSPRDGDRVLVGVRNWIASLTVTDMNEIVADGGITAGMVVGQEAVEQLRRLDAIFNGDILP